jgi:thymidylate kinase
MDIDCHSEVLNSSCFVIVSGPDKVGKSWLTTRLVERLNAMMWRPMMPYHWFDPELGPEAKMTLHKQWLEQYLEQIYGLAESYVRFVATRGAYPTRVVMDRFWPDEWAYATVFGRPTYDDAEYRAIDQVYANIVRARLVIVLERDTELVRRRWAEESKIPFDYYVRLLKAFEEFARWTFMPSMIVSDLAAKGDGAVEEVARWAAEGASKRSRR